VLVLNKLMEIYMASGTAEEVEFNMYLTQKRIGFRDWSKNSRTFVKL
jgi:hypothetical protein